MSLSKSRQGHRPFWLRRISVRRQWTMTRNRNASGVSGFEERPRRDDEDAYLPSAPEIPKRGDVTHRDHRAEVRLRHTMKWRNVDTMAGTHANPVSRSLVAHPGDWEHSSWRFYERGEPVGPVLWWGYSGVTSTGTMRDDAKEGKNGW